MEVCLVVLYIIPDTLTVSCSWRSTIQCSSLLCSLVTGGLCF